MWEPGVVLNFETKRFLLRSMTAEDVDDEYISWWNDPQIQDGLNSPIRNWSRTHAVHHIKRFDNLNKFHLGIFRKGTGALVGFVAIIHKKNVKNVSMNIVVGNKNFWGARVPSELRDTLFSFVFKQLGAEKIKSEVVGHNRSALKMCELLGFRKEGVLRQEKPHYRSGRVNVHLFGLLAEEWSPELSPKFRTVH